MSHHGLEHDEPSTPRKLEALRAMLAGMGVDPATASLSEVQDAVYLAQVAGFDLGYRFEWRQRMRPRPATEAARAAGGEHGAE